MNTYLSEELEIADNKAKYDAQVKKILADKNILAWILKHCAKEFMDLEIEEIKQCIEGEPKISTVPVYPGRTFDKMTGLSTEDSVPNEGSVTYDIRFFVMLPQEGGKEEKTEYIKLFINVEAQKEYYPGYDLVTRCMFYLARQISAQLDTEFTPDNYDNMKKVYSIWICMDTPKYAENTITKYEMQQVPIVGNFKGNARYDLMTGVMVCLGKELCQEKGSLIHLLGTLLTNEISPKGKEEILKETYDIAVSKPSKEVLGKMCNLSELIEEKGMEKGIEKGIVSLVEAMEELGQSKENILQMIMKKFSLTEEKAKTYI